MCVKAKEIYFVQNAIVHMNYIIEGEGALVNPEGFAKQSR